MWWLCFVFIVNIKWILCVKLLLSCGRMRWLSGLFIVVVLLVLLYCCWCCVVVSVFYINATPTREKCIQQPSTSNAGKYITWLFKIFYWNYFSNRVTPTHLVSWEISTRRRLNSWTCQITICNVFKTSVNGFPVGYVTCVPREMG